MRGEFDGLYRRYLGDHWLWGKAIATVESEENPWAISPDGGAVGLLQQRLGFIHDYREIEHPDAWHPVSQIVRLAQFWFAHSDQTIEERVLRYHYRGSNPEPVTSDPDNYWERVLNTKGLLGTLRHA